VIAREHGVGSWNALRDRVEELGLEFGAAVDRFMEAATDGRADRAERLLALQPRIAGANLHTALLRGDVAAVESRLAEDPALAVRPGGPRGWEPLLYLCHTSLGRSPVARPDGQSRGRRLAGGARRGRRAVGGGPAGRGVQPR
jgi:hypothetical protein